MKTLIRLLMTSLLVFGNFSGLKASNPDLINLYLMSDVIFNKTFKTTEGKSLIFEGSSGDVRIYTWDKQEVRLRIFGDPDALDKLDLLYYETSSGIKIKIKRISSIWSFFFGKVYVDYELTVPKKYNLNVLTSGGDILVKNLTGDAKLKTSGGDIKLESISGDLNATTSGGDIVLKNINGKVNAITTGGDIRLEEIEGDVNCTTTGGDIRIKVRNGSVSAKTTGGDIIIDLYGKEKGVKASTVGGNIRVTLDNDFQGYFSLSTIGGDVSYDFHMTNIFSKSSSKLEAEVGKSEPRIECKTTGGDIKILKRSN
ncbi:MAG: DUF4097 domain-containing protein [Ignavibacteria bacterium]|nr:DUF4097 domain-containing protein [Ignavibacteria bacterium]MDH7526790.1 DUF4097 family beta strand repeat-containing protein [Ignavibacteria bacterium]